MKNSGVYYVAVLLALLLSPWLYAERMAVRTTAVTASGQTVREHLHVIDLDNETVTPASVRLPGVVPPGSGAFPVEGEQFVLSVEPGTAESTSGEDAGHSSVIRLGIADLFTGHVPRISASQGWRYVNALSSADHALIGALSVRQDANLPPAGRLDVFDVTRFSPRFDGEFPVEEWPLPGPPVLAVLLRDGTTLAIVCQGRSASETVLHVRDMATGDVRLQARSLSAEVNQFGAHLAGAALSRDGAHLFILTSGYALATTSGESASWLHVLDTAQFNEVATPMFILGSARVADRPLRPTAGGACWIATRAPETGVAYATSIRVGEASAEILSHVSFPGVSRAIRIAPAPDGPGVAVAWDNRLEFWPTGQPADRPASFEAPVGALEWTESGLVLGEGGRIHRFDLDEGTPVKTIQFQSGSVSGIVALLDAESERDADADGLTDAREKRLGTSPNNQDTDGDGIPDGRDREPSDPSPELILPKRIAFHGEAVGDELRSIVVDQTSGDGPRVRLEYDEALMPWLGADVHTDATATTITLGVEPASYSPGAGETVSGLLTVRMEGTRPNIEATGSPAQIEVSVTAARDGARRVLWIHKTGTSNGGTSLDALKELLSAPPYYFTHRTVSGPSDEELDGYTIVALDTGAAAQGAMTRQALLEYVAAGGALLLLGSFDADGATASLTDWLGPIGIHLAPSALVEGRFSVVGEHEIGRHWVNFEVRDGLEMRVNEPSTVVIGDTSGRAIVAQRSYGLGRVIAMASVSPFGSRSLEGVGNRKFAGDLFRWLARARREIQDRDGDRLADGQEDRNNNGRLDPGETDYLHADSDRDGLPDGLEDANRNGVFDEGESSPLNPDSDGDGINDGADMTPLAPAGSPYVASVRPGSGPAEGGTSVLVLGQNFPPRTAVWFGRRLSPQVRRIDSSRLIAVTPAFGGDEEDPVMVRAVDVAGGLEGTFTNGFQYTARSVVQASLRTLEAASMQYNVYQGSFALQLEAPWIGLGPSTFVIEAEPREAIVAMNVVPGLLPEDAQRQVVATQISDSELRIEVSAGTSMQSNGRLATVQWVARPVARNDALQFNVVRSFVTARFGGPLQVDTSSLTVPLARSGGRLPGPPGRFRNRGARPGGNR
jgi:hypothetical protein